MRASQRSLAAFSFTVAVLASPALAGDLPTFDLHFVVLTKNAAAQQVATISQLRREVGILNEFFVTDARTPLVHFRFKGATLYAEAQKADCELARLGDLHSPLNTDRVAQLFNTCADPRARDPRAINFYIYDAHAPGVGFADATGHGRRNDNRPFVFLDWSRLNHGDQAAEEHEMGHAFGLGHVCVSGATRSTPTNIMASADCGKGSGGLRNIGFNAQQARTILNYARRIEERLR